MREPTPKPCLDCDGTGVSHEPEWLDDPPADTCPTCGGKGWHTAGGNDPTPCGRCEAGAAFADRLDADLHQEPYE
jgi:DnaJ-class molecular chaperone